MALAGAGSGSLDLALDVARRWAADAAISVSRLVVPDPVADLTEWLGDTRAQAVLFQLDADAPDDVYLLLSENARVDEVLAALGGVAQRGAPLDGHLALLTWDNTWRTWADRTRMPVLEEELTEANWRGVIGNFASARPRIFVATLVVTALLSVLIANSYIATSRRQR